jgi:sirohydrochlorin cobaltochelatase
LSQGYEIHPFRETSIDDKCDRCHDDREDDQVTTNCEPALLLIAHGTRDPRGAAEMATLVDHLRERIAAPVGAAWLEDFAEPDAVTATGALVDAGAEALVTLPLLNFGAMHAKTDVPGDVVDIRARFPDLPVAHGRVLDIHPALLALARDRVAAVSPADERGDEVLMVTGAGSSDPDANGDLAKAARMLAEATGHRWVEIAYAGVSWPRADELLARLERAGARRVVRFSWSLLAGLLERRVNGWADEAIARGMDVRDAWRFGPDPLVADAVVDRYREAIAGDARMNCDLCAYRRPLPGREERVGQPSPAGLGTAVHPSVTG